jgi:hypothetical protein
MNDKKTIRNIILAGLALYLFMPKSKASTGNYSGLGNGYTPTNGNEGSMNESYLGLTNAPRGIRNNNPGNIKYYATNNWQGKVNVAQNTDAIDPNDNEPTFEQFTSYPYGIRAMIYLIKNSYIANGYNTLDTILDRYDPGHSNSYLQYLSTRVNIPTTQSIGVNDETAIKKLIQALARWENGQTDPQDLEVITDIQYQTARSIL